MCKYDHRPQQSVYSTEIFQIWKTFLGAKYHHVGGRRNSTGTYLHTPHTRKQITEPSLGGLITSLTKAFRVNNECSEIISHGHFMSSMLTDCTRWPTASTHTDVAWQTDQCLTMPTICACACAGPTLWNKRPRNIRDNSNITQFKKQLKTLLFST